MNARPYDELDDLHAHVSDTLLACSRCAESGRINHSDLLEVARLLTTAQLKLHQLRSSQPPPRPGDKGEL